MLVFGLSRTNQRKFLKKNTPTPPFSLEKNKSAFLGCFSEKNTQMDALTHKIEVQPILYACFLTFK